MKTKAVATPSIFPVSLFVLLAALMIGFLAIPRSAQAIGCGVEVRLAAQDKTFTNPPATACTAHAIGALTHNPKVVDLCPNIAGAQDPIPSGMVLNASGNCVAAATDVCPNILGYQDVIPIGMILDASGSCVTPAPAPPAVASVSVSSPGPNLLVVSGASLNSGAGVAVTINGITKIYSPTSAEVLVWSASEIRLGDHAAMNGVTVTSVKVLDGLYPSSNALADSGPVNVFVAAQADLLALNTPTSSAPGQISLTTALASENLTLAGTITIRTFDGVSYVFHAYTPTSAQVTSWTNNLISITDPDLAGKTTTYLSLSYVGGVFAVGFSYPVVSIRPAPPAVSTVTFPAVGHMIVTGTNLNLAIGMFAYPNLNFFAPSSGYTSSSNATVISWTATTIDVSFTGLFGDPILPIKSFTLVDSNFTTLTSFTLPRPRVISVTSPSSGVLSITGANMYSAINLNNGGPVTHIIIGADFGTTSFYDPTSASASLNPAGSSILAWSDTSIIIRYPALSTHPILGVQLQIGTLTYGYDYFATPGLIAL